uniref:Uncharacterized protein n=1 Tax=Sphaerodactylus townsendi TaxID=933632 RepID=A0ACB8EV04_9SAUR
MLDVDYPQFEGSQYGYMYHTGSIYDLDSCKQELSFPSCIVDPESSPAIAFTDSCVNWLELQEPGYADFEVGHLAQLQNVQVAYVQSSYSPPSLESVYNHAEMMPLENMCVGSKDEFNAQIYIPYDHYSVPEAASSSSSEEPPLELSDSESDENLLTGFDPEFSQDLNQRRIWWW